MTDDKLFNDQDLLAIVAHDLKTPITAVRGYIELIERMGELNDKQRHFCQRALLGLDRMENLITSVLDFARLEGDVQMHFVDCDLRPIIQNAVDLLEQAAAIRDITFHVELVPKLSLVIGDPQWLGEVMNNLLSNAIKYNRQGGEVWVNAAHQPGFVRISVRDTGEGIAAEDQGRVFERFFRTRSARGQAEGSGLGLTIVQAVIEKHGGQIWVESVPGEGSTFTFTVPRKPRTGKLSAGENQRDTSSRERHPHGEAHIEASDAVNDDAQEASGTSFMDSASELV
jgi:signal transduction histidine kinase